MSKYRNNASTLAKGYEEIDTNPDHYKSSSFKTENDYVEGVAIYTLVQIQLLLNLKRAGMMMVFLQL